MPTLLYNLLFHDILGWWFGRLRYCLNLSDVAYLFNCALFVWNCWCIRDTAIRQRTGHWTIFYLFFALCLYVIGYSSSSLYLNLEDMRQVDETEILRLTVVCFFSLQLSTPITVSTGCKTILAATMKRRKWRIRLQVCARLLREHIPVALSIAKYLTL